MYLKAYELLLVNTYAYMLKRITITDPRKNKYKLVEQVNEMHKPVQITGKKNNAILDSEEDWRVIP